MATKAKQEAQQPLILRAHRLMEAFAKSDDERDFYLDRLEGFIVFVDLDKSQAEIEALENELQKNSDRYCLIPKLTFFETKKIMEGFVNEKVYDIDTKEKLLEIIQSKEARYNFLEFLYDHHSEQDKWQQYYQERSRVRIIEWLRNNHFHFVFEEDLDLARNLIERIKQSLFETKAHKDVINTRKILVTKAKSYYSNEALNPRPKRGRPPKQAVKQEIEPQFTTDIFLTVPEVVRTFLFSPDITSASAVTFSADFESPEAIASKRQSSATPPDHSLENLQQKLAALRSLTSSWQEENKGKPKAYIDNEDQLESPKKTNLAKSKKPVKKAQANPPKKVAVSESNRKRHLRPVKNVKQAQPKRLEVRKTSTQKNKSPLQNKTSSKQPQKSFQSKKSDKKRLRTTSRSRTR